MTSHANRAEAALQEIVVACAPLGWATDGRPETAVAHVREVVKRWQIDHAIANGAKEHTYWAGHYQTALREAETVFARVLALADLIDRHTEREAEPVEFRHADTGMWHGVADEIRAALGWDALRNP